MARDCRSLNVFREADALALEVYRYTSTFPDSERYGLASQLRRAAVSTPANIAEGTERTTEKDFLRLVDIAAGSASETRYLLAFSRRLGVGDGKSAAALEARYDSLLRGLQNLRTALRQSPDRV